MSTGSSPGEAGAEEQLRAQAAAIKDAGGAPEDAELLLACAAAALISHQWSAAAELCQGALRFDPEHPRSWALLGCAADGLGELEQAAEAYQRALSIDPQDGQSAMRLAELCERGGELARARALAGPLARRLPQSSLRERARALLGRVGVDGR